MNDVHKQKFIAERYKAVLTDIVFLQEIFIDTIAGCEELARKMGGRGFCSPGTGNSKGVMIVVRNQVDFELEMSHHDYDGRIVWVDCKINRMPVRLVCIYAPNNHTERKEFLQQSVLNVLVSNRKLVMGGDFNFVENIDLDKTGSSACGDRGRVTMSELRTDYLISDAFRHLYKDKIAYSHYASE